MFKVHGYSCTLHWAFWSNMLQTRYHSAATLTYNLPRFSESNSAPHWKNLDIDLHTKIANL